MSAIPASPVSMTFRCLQQNLITWTLTDASGNPVTGKTVNATLYSDRSRSNPTLQPGTVSDPAINNLSLPETTPGTYQGVVSNTFNPAQSSSGFLIVITASAGATLIDTWPVPAVVIFPGAAVDLVELDDVKSWLGIASTNTDADGILQLLVSSFSRYVLTRTGQSSFTSIGTYTEIYDGNGATRLFLRNTPIVSVISINVGTSSVVASGGITNSGWYIDPSARCIALRSGAGSYPRTESFTRGQGNIQVVYTAGYTSVPFDLQEAVIEAVGINYSRKDWIDLASKSLSISGGTGTTTYRNWHLPPGIEYTLQYYSRRALAY